MTKSEAKKIEERTIKLLQASQSSLDPHERIAASSVLLDHVRETLYMEIDKEDWEESL